MVEDTRQSRRERGGRPIRIAAAGDLHCHEENRDRIESAFRGLADTADLALLAGDLTTHGNPEEAAVLADACRSLTIPIVAVLGNHDWHLDRAEEVTATLTEAGIVVLDRDWKIVEVAGTEVGVVGTKGFVGGFPGSHLSDFGEPALRMIYAETTAEVKAIARGLREVATCPVRIVLLHYSPTETTLEGEPEGIWAFLGTDRMAAPIREHEPDLVVHGHAHHGSVESSIADIPVYNVSVPLMGRDFWVLELMAEQRPAPPVH